MENSGTKINDLFFWCNNLEVVRDFYSNILGLIEQSYEPDKKKYGHAWVSYKLGNEQNLTFNCRTENVIIEQAWSFQPSSRIQEGIDRLSWTMEMSQKDFENANQRLLKSEYKYYQKIPEIRQGYTALTLMDPLGNTIDLYYLH